MAKLRKSQLRQNFEKEERTQTILDKTVSSFVYYSTPTMKYYLSKLDLYRINNYKSVNLLENLYNYTEKIKK